MYIPELVGTSVGVAGGCGSMKGWETMDSEPPVDSVDKMTIWDGIGGSARHRVPGTILEGKGRGERSPAPPWTSWQAERYPIISVIDNPCCFVRRPQSFQASRTSITNFIHILQPRA